MDESKIKILFLKILSAFFVVLAFLIVYLIFGGPISKFVNSLPAMRTTSVNAEGKAVATPDAAKFSFSVVSEGKDPEVLVKNNNQKMNEAVDFVKAQGVDEKDIKTTQYNLSPRYVYDDKTHRQYIVGYELTQTALVKVRDLEKNLDKVTKMLGALPEYGINQIGSISFEVEDPDKYLAEARDKAFEKAKAKAQKMAEVMGVKLGRVVNFNEYQQPGPIPYYGLGGGVAESMKAVAPSIQPGSQEITIQVYVTYELQ